MALPKEPGEEAALCIEDIESADFVAVRLDTSGSFTDGRAGGGKAVEIADHYDALVEQLRKTLPLRLGVCCCVWRPGSSQWELRSHELDLWPGDALEMPAGTAAKRFQLAQGCAPSGGAPDEEARKGKAKPASRWAPQLACSTQWIVAALHRARRPLVFHSGLLDLLQIYDKFVGDVPENHLDFGLACVQLFPVIFDTCLLAKGQSSLEEAVEKVWGLPRTIPSTHFKEFGMYTHRASSKRLHLVGGGGIGSTARDAMAVAELFLLQMGLRIKAGALAGGLKGPGESEAGGTKTASDGKSPSDQAAAAVTPEAPEAPAAAATPEAHGAAAAEGPAAEVPAASPPAAAERARAVTVPVPLGGAGPEARRKRAPEPQEFPVARTKRARCALDDAAACVEAVSSLSARIAGVALPPLNTKDLRNEACRAACRRFLNRVAAPGADPGYLRLDSLVQLRLAKRLKSQRRSDVRGLLRELWAPPGSPACDN